MKKSTIEDFITKAKQIYDDRYDYSLVEYTNNKTKVKIVCPIHGVFEQRPNDHLSGHGCKSCGYDKNSYNQTITTDEFITKAKQIHGDRYDYSLVEYINSSLNIKIICKDHGVFEQKPIHHLHNRNNKGCGCPRCARENTLLTIDDFITKAKQVHGDRYDYSLVEYKNIKTKVKIKCDIHGVFEQVAGIHIYGNSRGCGCTKCWNRVADIIYLNKNLTIEEDPIEMDGDIKCRCTYCKNYFTPTPAQLRCRIGSLSNNRNGESRLYCSDECKNMCPIFGQVLYPKGDKPYKERPRPDQPELRRMVLERDNYQCQRCGDTEDLQCHHITGVEINPIESADIDNCIILCYTCHSKSHSDKGCNMRRELCK